MRADGAGAIIAHQKEFLDNGPEFIEPLKMQQIAERVGVHVTTVSRAVDDKFHGSPHDQRGGEFLFLHHHERRDD